MVLDPKRCAVVQVQILEYSRHLESLNACNITSKDRGLGKKEAELLRTKSYSTQLRP